MSDLIKKLQEELEQAGYKIEVSPLHSSGWYAYNPSMRVGSAKCESNHRAPQLIVTAHDTTVHGITLKSAEFEVAGEIPSRDPSGVWIKFTVYGITFNTVEDVVNAIPMAHAIASSAWDAAHASASALKELSDKSVLEGVRLIQQAEQLLSRRRLF